MSIIVHLEPGSKANGGLSKPEGATSVTVTVRTGDESESGAATKVEKGDKTSQDKGSDKQRATHLHWKTGR